MKWQLKFVTVTVCWYVLEQIKVVKWSSEKGEQERVDWISHYIT